MTGDNLATIADTFRGWAKAAETEVVADGVDRHGAFQWIARWEHESLVRYVEWDIVAAVAAEADQPVLAYETWAAAEQEDRYVRQLVGKSTVMVSLDVLVGEVAAATLRRGMDMANSFVAGDLRSAHQARSISSERL